jgi:hypothetical protein
MNEGAAEAMIVPVMGSAAKAPWIRRWHCNGFIHSFGQTILFCLHSIRRVAAAPVCATARLFRPLVDRQAPNLGRPRLGCLSRSISVPASDWNLAGLTLGIAIYCVQDRLVGGFHRTRVVRGERVLGRQSPMCTESKIVTVLVHPASPRRTRANFAGRLNGYLMPAIPMISHNIT